MTAGLVAREDVPDRPRTLRRALPGADRTFRAAVTGTGALVFVLMVAIGVFLFLRAREAVGVAGWSFLTEQEWQPDSGRFGVAALLVGTVVIALVALVVSVPVALGAAVYVAEYAPPGLRRTMISLIDLMAAVPSIVYGLWGVFLLTPWIISLSRWLSDYLGWIPIFRVAGVDTASAVSSPTVYTASAFIAGIVVALMVTPIACSIMREVFSQAPIGEREAALALGSTRWGVIRTVVLPFGRGGIVGGTMLGLGRALGETIAVYLIISPLFEIKFRILEAGAIAVAPLIALRYGEASPFALSALMAAGLSLFALTLLVNMVAGVLIARSRSGAATEI